MQLQLIMLMSARQFLPGQLFPSFSVSAEIHRFCPRIEYRTMESSADCFETACIRNLDGEENFPYYRLDWID